MAGTQSRFTGMFGWFANRSQRLTTRTWIIIGSVLFIALLLMGGHQSGLTLPVFHDDKKPPPPPPPKEEYPRPAAPGEMINWEPPVMDALVHGVHASDGIKRKPKYPLEPFPSSPMAVEPQDDGKQRPWLGAVICSAWDIKRRMLIRYTWMKLYKDVPMDQRFVVSNPGPLWTEIVQQENRTYGDMIVLDTLQEDDFTANTVKTIEFYRWLVEKSPKKYEFVSKMDTDLWVNARGMYDRKIVPRMDENNGALTANVNHTIIGQFYYDGYHKTSFPHGAIYTVTWDIVELLPTLQDQYHIIAGEDVTMAWLLMKARQKVTMAILNEAEKFEFDKKDRIPGMAWARKGTDVTSMWHALAGKDVLAIHQLKEDNDWLQVAECFDEKGIIDTPELPDEPPPSDKPGFPRPWFRGIPDRYWETDVDGTLLCNGVWKLEPGVDRDMKKKED